MIAWHMKQPCPGIILCIQPANERIVTSPFIGWTHIQNDPCMTNMGQCLTWIHKQCRQNQKKQSTSHLCLYHVENTVCRFSTLRPRENGCHFADIFKCIFFNENVRISLAISLEFVRTDSNNTILALVWIMAWRRPGDKPLSEPMMDSLLTHIHVTQPQRFKHRKNLRSD